MKKIITILLILSIAYSMFACASNPAPKYYGTWADETQYIQLHFRSDGLAVLRHENNIYEYKWEAIDYGTVLLYEMSKSAIATNDNTIDPSELTGVLDTTTSTDSIGLNDATTENIIGKGTEPVEGIEPVDSTEPVDGTEPIDGTESVEDTKPGESTDTTKKPEEDRIIVATCTFTIVNGVMYLTVSDENSNAVCVLSKQN